MVVSWGTMWRRPHAIWGTRNLADIHAALAACAQSIQNIQSIQTAWAIMTGNQVGQLEWSAVITSKTLHFLCRALGFQHDPPVAIDNTVILNNVWPAFLHPIPAAQRPMNWRGNMFDAYCRYMTAIITWANQRQWTTTEMEATIFDQYRPNQYEEREHSSEYKFLTFLFYRILLFNERPIFTIRRWSWGLRHKCG